MSPSAAIRARRSARVSVLCETVSKCTATIVASGASRASATTSSLSITIGPPSSNCAALALTTITLGAYSATAARTSSQRIVSPAM